MHSFLDLVEARGPLTFAEYVELALYDPILGYYSRHVPGPNDDYQTSPSLSMWFGRLLGKLFGAMHENLGKARDFDVVELGAGSAHLAGSILGSTSAPPLRWTIVERFEEIEMRQRAALQRSKKVSWVASLGTVGPFEGCIFANEVLDNFPMHVLEVREDGVAEIYVRAVDGSLKEELGPLSDPRLEAHASRAVPELEIGDRFEVTLALDDFSAEVSAAIRRGYLLVIDYGDVEPHLWTRRPAGSVVTYGASGLDLDVLAEPGHRDITAHVNFSHLSRSLESFGWTISPLGTQRQMLIGLGAGKAEDELRQAQHSAEKKGAGPEVLRLMSERSALTTLYRPGGLGDLRVLIASKNAPPIEG